MAEDATFKVTDRRRRTDEAVAPETPVAEAPADTPAAPPPDTHHEPATPPGPDGGEADLQGLFVMFASAALIGLGAAPDPASGQPQVDLDQAQEAIETLLLLRAKTEGNRTEAESRLLEEILYDLQMRFVRMTRGGSPAR